MLYNITMSKKKLVVQKNEAGERLDKLLVEKFPQYSRSYFQKMIKGAKVLVNAKNVAAHTMLKENDEVTIELVEPTKISLEPDPSIKLDIVFEDQDFLVINKPAGLVVHPSQSNPKHTLVNGILAYYPPIASVGDNTFRPGIVHRLDKEVSGLIAVAKNQSSFLHLKEQFQKRTINKRYLALVHGKLSQTEGEIDLNIGRSQRKPSRMSVKQKREGKSALTHYRVLKEYGRYSLLEITTKTGRTHQIRVHLFSLGHSIAGDKIYRNKNIKTNQNISRIFLHAGFLQFIGREGELKEFKVDLPLNLSRYLSDLKAQSSGLRAHSPRPRA